jgi:hypothetical protein
MEQEINDVKADVQGLELYSDNYPFRLPLVTKSFENEGEFTKFVRNCEKLFRGSLEYKLWKQYIIEVLGISECMLTKESINECTVEVHHHIPSLFVLMKTLVSKKLVDQEGFTSFDIAKETMGLHYMNKVGYAVLVKALHERLHNGVLEIPIRIVRGDYKYFIDTYKDYLDEEDLELLNRRMSINNITDSELYNWSKDNYPGIAEVGK